MQVEQVPLFFFFFTLVTGPRSSLSLKLSDTRVYGPQIRARLGTTAIEKLTAAVATFMHVEEVPLNLGTTTSQKCAAVPRRARI